MSNCLHIYQTKDGRKHRIAGKLIELAAGGRAPGGLWGRTRSSMTTVASDDGGPRTAQPIAGQALNIIATLRLAYANAVPYLLNCCARVHSVRVVGVGMVPL